MKPAFPPKEEGFALPLAIGVGLFMIIIATTMIIRSNQSQIASLSQRSSHKSLAAAETGVAKYIDFFNRYREFASESSFDPDNLGANPWNQYLNQIKTQPGCNDYAETEELLSNFGNELSVDNNPRNGRYLSLIHI